MAGIARPPCDEAAILAGSCQRPDTADGPWILTCAAKEMPYPYLRIPYLSALSRGTTEEDLIARPAAGESNLRAPLAQAIVAVAGHRSLTRLAVTNLEALAGRGASHSTRVESAGGRPWDPHTSGANVESGLTFYCASRIP